jgi:hypothetical protein
LDAGPTSVEQLRHVVSEKEGLPLVEPDEETAGHDA